MLFGLPQVLTPLGGGGGERGGGSSASQVSALDFRWRWGSAFLKDKTRWGLVLPVVGVIMASYRVEGTRSLTKFRLSPLLLCASPCYPRGAGGLRLWWLTR